MHEDPTVSASYTHHVFDVSDNANRTPFNFGEGSLAGGCPVHGGVYVPISPYHGAALVLFGCDEHSHGAPPTAFLNSLATLCSQAKQLLKGTSAYHAQAALADLAADLEAVRKTWSSRNPTLLSS